MPACKCGNKKFFAVQEIWEEVVVDERNRYRVTQDLYSANEPVGPYICTECGEEYDSLKELPNEDSD